MTDLVKECQEYPPTAIIVVFGNNDFSTKIGDPIIPHAAEVEKSPSSVVSSWIDTTTWLAHEANVPCVIMTPILPRLFIKANNRVQIRNMLTKKNLLVPYKQLKVFLLFSIDF